MAGILAYQGSDLPDSVKRALENEKNYRKAIQNKIPLAERGSAVPDGVRKAAQAALERGPSVAQAAAPEAAQAAGRGILGRAGGAIFGPLGLGVQAAFTPGDLGDGELTAAQQQAQATQAVENMGPEAALSAAQFAQDASQNAVDNKFGGPQGAELLQVPQEPEPEMQMDAPQQSPMEIPEAAPQAAPEPTPEEAKASAEEQAQAQEVERQTVEQGAVEGLRTGQVSRSELADAVVDADAARNGTQLKPEEKQAKVAEELTQMRTMGDSDLAKYVSWAIMGVGLVASVMDKSGETGRYFADSYNKELDRQAQYGAMLNKNREAALDRQLKDREVTVKEKTGDSTVETNKGNLEVKRGTLQNDTAKTGGILKKWENDDSNAKAATAVKRYGIDVGASTATRGQDLRAASSAASVDATKRGQDMTQETAKLRTAADLAKARQSNEVRLEAAKISAAAREKAARGESLTLKDTYGIIDAYDGKAVVGKKKLSDDAKAKVAINVRNELRNNPTADPAGIVAREYQNVTGKKGTSILGFGGKTSLPEYK